MTDNSLLSLSLSLSFRHWEKRLGVGPFHDGMPITDHPNLNINLTCIRVIMRQGYSIYNTMEPTHGLEWGETRTYQS